MQRSAAAASRAANFKIPTTAALYKRRPTRWPPQTPHALRYQMMRSLAQVPECWDTIHVPLVPWCSNHKDFQGYCRAGGKSTQISSPSSLYNLCFACALVQQPQRFPGLLQGGRQVSTDLLSLISVQSMFRMVACSDTMSAAPRFSPLQASLIRNPQMKPA